MEKRSIRPLQAGRVRLRLIEEQDLPRTLAWRNQEHIRRWFFASELLAPEEHIAWFARYQNSPRRLHLYYRGSGPAGGVRPIGQVALYNIDWVRGTAEFGRLMIGEATLPAAAWPARPPRPSSPWAWIYSACRKSISK